MPKKVGNPFKMGYDPELDTSPELDPDAASCYLTITGILRLMIELGRIDIITKVSLLSSHAALSREGHLEAAVHIMAHVGQRYNSTLVYYPLYLEKDHSVFKECDWSEFYRNSKEEFAVNAPEPYRKEVDIHMFVDSHHAGNKVSRRSRSGFLIYVNTALVQWFLKKQFTVDTSVFGTEFVAMKQGIDTL